MEDIMTDKQMEILLTLVADKFAGCKDMEEVEKAIQEVREMAQKNLLTKVKYFSAGFKINSSIYFCV